MLIVIFDPCILLLKELERNVNLEIHWSDQIGPQSAKRYVNDETNIDKSHLAI